MSRCITELHLESAPFTVDRCGNTQGLLWRGNCGVCEHKTPKRVLLGVVLADIAEHMDLHRLTLREQEAELKKVNAKMRNAA